MAAINITGNKKLETIRKEFNAMYPYLKIGFWEKKHAMYQGVKQLYGNKTVAEVRTTKGNVAISINGNKKIKSVEDEISKALGIACEIGFTDKVDGVMWTKLPGSAHSSFDNETLSTFNEFLSQEPNAKKSTY